MAAGRGDRPLLHHRRLHAHVGPRPCDGAGRPPGRGALRRADGRDGLDRGTAPFVGPVRPGGPGPGRRGRPDEAHRLHRPRPLLAPGVPRLSGAGGASVVTRRRTASHRGAFSSSQTVLPGPVPRGCVPQASVSASSRNSPRPPSASPSGVPRRTGGSGLASLTSIRIRSGSARIDSSTSPCPYRTALVTASLTTSRTTSRKSPDHARATRLMWSRAWAGAPGTGASTSTPEGGSIDGSSLPERGRRTPLPPDIPRVGPITPSGPVVLRRGRSVVVLGHVTIGRIGFVARREMQVIRQAEDAGHDAQSLAGADHSQPAAPRPQPR